MPDGVLQCLHRLVATPVCVNFELRPGAGDIHICWFNFDALAQGNAYKPTYIHTYIFVVVNFDAVAQASDIRIERRQVVFLC